MMNRTVTPRRRLNRTGPSAARLEPRIVFDGAAPVDAATALADAAAAVAAPPEPTLADLPPAVHDQAQDHAPPAVRLASDTASTDADVASLAAVDQQARDIIATYLGGSDGIEALFTVFRGGEDVAQGPSAEWAERAQSLLDALAGGDFGVTFQVLDGDQIGGAHAAFTATGPTGEPTIFINGEWWAAQTDTSVLARTLVEEYGHAFDHALNGDADTAGDEGEAFAAAATGSHVTIIDEARIAAEDDHGIATVDGTDYVVERASISFINAYRVYTGDGFPAEKEQNRHHYVDEALGVTNIDDMVSSTYFSGNDVVVQMTIDGNTYYGWVSRPIKSGGVVRGFYF